MRRGNASRAINSFAAGGARACNARMSQHAPSVSARLGYLEPGCSHPYEYAYPPPDGGPWHNGGYDHRAVSIADARASSTPPSLGQEGYALLDAPSSVADFRDETAVRQVYYAEMAELARAATGAARAYVFDHLVRRREPGRPALSFGRRVAGRQVATNGRVHNDYTEDSGRRRLGMVLPERPEQTAVRRHGIVNIWRSVGGPVLDTPLALCDARTVLAADLVPGEVRYPGRTGEIYLVVHSPRHRWSYFPAVDRHEAVVFTQFDSEVSATARFTPHAAFDLPEVPPDAPLRESIEIRCLVVYE